MPKPSPFHERTLSLCKSMKWRDWGGYYAVESYDTSHDTEYAAIRYSVGIMDVSPLFKYSVTGKDALRFLNRVIAKDVEKLQDKQVTYCCWTEDEGKMIDDGTLTRISETDFRVTAAEPSLQWFHQFSRGYDVKIEDITDSLGALAIQGPFSRDLLTSLCGDSVKNLKFFRFTEATIDGVKVDVSRTGYTGDLGYEVWVPKDEAIKVYDAIYNEGKKFGIQPFGLNALDVTRVEAGFIMNGVDYFSAHHCIIETRKSTPYELGLGWTVNAKKNTPFIGKQSLLDENKNGSKWAFVGLVLDWDEQEALYAEHDLPPEICNHAWREAVPVYDEVGNQIGKATSGTWSPILKQNLALATVLKDYAKEGTRLQMEYTVEYERKKVSAIVTKTPFFNPDRKRKTP